jgi:hypothetical protein
MEFDRPGRDSPSWPGRSRASSSARTADRIARRLNARRRKPPRVLAKLATA